MMNLSALLLGLICTSLGLLLSFGNAAGLLFSVIGMGLVAAGCRQKKR